MADIRQALSRGTQYSGYEIVDCVGYGGSSLVYRVKKGARVFILKEIYPYKLAESAKICRDEETGAVKLVKPTEERDRKQLQLYYDLQVQELIIAEELRDSLGANDPYILPAKAIVHNGVTSLLLETEGGKVLAEILCKRDDTDGKIVALKTLTDVLEMTKRVLECLAHIHAKGYIHADVAPDNLYVSDLMQDDLTARRTVKALDYNNACHISAVKTKDFSSKKKYAPLELIVNNKRSKIGYHTDLYSVGIILVEMLNPAHKLDGGSIKQLASPYFAGETNEVVVATIALLNEALVIRIADCDAFTQKINAILALIEHRHRLEDNFSPSDKFFTGRKSELAQIEQVYTETAANMAILKGIGGVGKTSIANQYAANNRETYRRIVVVPYQGTLFQTIVSDAAVCITNFTLDGIFPREEEPSGKASSEQEPSEQEPSEKLNIAPMDGAAHGKENEMERLEKYYAAKLHKLAGLVDADTLLMIDNMNNGLDERLHDIETLPCRVLITTRNYFAGKKQIEVLPFSSVEDSMDIFQHYYKKSLSKSEQDMVKEVIITVGSLPLIVELIAKSISASRMKILDVYNSFADYVFQYPKEKILHDKNSSVLNTSVNEILKIIFDLSALTQAEKDVLRNLSLIPYEGIETDTFKEMCGFADYDAINNLVNIGYIGYDETADKIFLHPVISDLCGKELEPDNIKCEELIQNCIAEMELFHHFDSLEKQTRLDLYYSVSMKIAFKDTNWEILEKFYYLLDEFSVYNDRNAVQEKLKSLYLSAFGENSTQTMDIMLKIGKSYGSQYDGYKSLEFKIYIDHLNISDKQVYNISFSHYNKGNFETALAHKMRGMKICETIYGSTSTQLIDCYESIARTYSSKYDKKNSLKYRKQALEIHENFHEKDILRAKLIFQQGWSHYLNLEIKKALDLFNEGISLQLALDGFNKDLIVMYNAIGNAYISIGAYSESLSSRKKALSLCEKIDLENRESLLANTYNNLGSSYDMVSDFEQSIYCKTLALNLYKKIYGDIEHVDIATIYNSIGYTYDNNNAFDQAISYKEKSLAMWMSLFEGELHSDVAAQYNNLATSFYLNNEYEKSLPLYLKSLEMLNELYDESNPEQFKATLNLAHTYLSLYEKNQCVDSYCLKSIDTYKKALDIYLALGNENDLTYQNLEKQWNALQYSADSV